MHQISVTLNGIALGITQLESQAHTTTSFSVPMALLHDGDNQITVQSLNGASDFSLVDRLRLTYAHRYVADGNALLWSSEGGQAVQVLGFTTAGVRAFDLTDAANPVEIEGQVDSVGGDYRLTVTPLESGARLLYAVSEAAVQPAAQVVAQRPSTWDRAANGLIC